MGFFFFVAVVAQFFVQQITLTRASKEAVPMTVHVDRNRWNNAHIHFYISVKCKFNILCLTVVVVYSKCVQYLSRAES